MKIGIICDLSQKFHMGISNYFQSLYNIFLDVKIVNNEYDLNGLEFLFIGNEHFGPHKYVWFNDSFINKCNNDGIKVIVWAGEQIFNTFYPQNINIQKAIEKFKNLHQVVIDVNDLKILNCKLGNFPLSKNYKGLKKNCKKKDRMIFIGSLHLPHYTKRVETINKLKDIYDFDVYENKFSSYKEYIELISEYRFVLNPHSTTLNGFSFRFYETLLVNSIPVHQVYEDTLDFYTVERDYKDAIYFQDPSEIIEKIEKCDLEESYNSPCFEDVLIKYFREEFHYKF